MSNINFECIICLENMKFASVGSCMHHFCYCCLYKHCNFSNTCPICKTVINEIKIDREFDLLINNSQNHSLLIIRVLSLNHNLTQKMSRQQHESLIWIKTGPNNSLYIFFFLLNFFR